MNTVLQILLLAIGYIAAGQLGLMLAIPPGYATAIFPASGIALAAILLWGYRLLPGVFIGSLCINIIITLGNNETLTLPGIINAMIIAGGATLQALAGGYVVRRYLPDGTALINEKCIAGFMFLIVPLSCLVSATIGVTTLYLTHTIPAEAYGTSWLNWWVGDTIGTALMTPVMLVIFNHARHKRLLTVILPTAIMLAIAVMIFIQSSHWSQQQTASSFREQVLATAENIRFRFEIYINQLHSLERLYASSDTVSAEEFRKFVDHTFLHYPGIQALEWLPRISATQRSQYEAQMRAAGYPEFVITERNSQQQLVPALNRKQYYPVTYLEPLSTNIKALGYDVASDAVRNQALSLAIQNHSAIMTAPIQLVQDSSKQAGALVFLPVIKSDKVEGVVLGVFKTGDLIDIITQSITRPYYLLQVSDVSDGQDDIIYQDKSFSQATSISDIEWRETYTIAGRELSLWFKPTPYFFASANNLSTWLVLVAGLVFCSLLMFLLLSITGRTQRVAALVDQRTSELQAILDNSVDAVLSFNHQGRIELANPAAASLFDYSPQSLYKAFITDLIPALQFNQAGELTLLDKGESLDVVGHSVETQAKRANGNDLDIELGIGLIDQAGQRRYAAIVHDIRERKKTEKIKNEFIATVSHELRTPLTSINGALSLLQGGIFGDIPAKAEEMIQLANKNCQRLTRLVNDILDVEKLEFGNTEFDLTTTSLDELLQESAQQNLGYAKLHNVEIKTSYTTDAVSNVQIKVDRGRFHQIMSNLLSNAIKFSPPGSSVEIDVELAEQAKISVRDNGSGIPADFHSQIFERFSQADGGDNKRQGGTGLGLNIVKTLVQRMGGEIDFISSEAQGTTFFFTLPYSLNGDNSQE